MLVYSANHDDTPTLMLPLCHTEALNYFSHSVFFIWKSILHPLLNTRYCGKSPWPKNRVLDLRPPGLKFRITKYVRSVASFDLFKYPEDDILSQLRLCSQIWSKATFIQSNTQSLHSFNVSLRNIPNCKVSDLVFWLHQYLICTEVMITSCIDLG